MSVCGCCGSGGCDCGVCLICISSADRRSRSAAISASFRKSPLPGAEACVVCRLSLPPPSPCPLPIRRSRCTGTSGGACPLGLHVTSFRCRGDAVVSNVQLGAGGIVVGTSPCRVLNAGVRGVPLGASFLRISVGSGGGVRAVEAAVKYVLGEPGVCGATSRTWGTCCVARAGSSVEGTSSGAYRGLGALRCAKGGGVDVVWPLVGVVACATLTGEASCWSRTGSACAAVGARGLASSSGASDEYRRLALGCALVVSVVREFCRLASALAARCTLFSSASRALTRSRSRRYAARIKPGSEYVTLLLSSSFCKPLALAATSSSWSSMSSSAGGGTASSLHVAHGLPSVSLVMSSRSTPGPLGMLACHSTGGACASLRTDVSASMATRSASTSASAASALSASCDVRVAISETRSETLEKVSCASVVSAARSLMSVTMDEADMAHKTCNASGAAMSLLLREGSPS